MALFLFMTKAMKKIKYERSLLFDVGKWSDDVRAKKIADIVTNIILPDLGKGYKLAHGRYTAAIMNLVINFIQCHEHPYCEWVACSRDQSSYTVGSRYNKLFISYRPLMRIIGAMVKHELIELVKGVNYPNFHRQSRMRPRLKFIELLYRKKKTRTYRKIELIRLKTSGKKKKKLVEYDDTSKTNNMRHNNIILNEWMAAAELHHDLTEEQAIMHIKAIGRCLDYSKSKMYRVFNGSFERGGRFYGPWWQEVKKEYRQFITIGGCPTVELDYASFHPRILYDRKGAILPEGDLYEVPGFKHRRKLCKILFNSLLNAPTRESAIKAAMREHNITRRPPHTVKKLEMVKLADHLIAKHEPIAEFLGSGIGLTLQHHDSCIAERIMLSLRDKGIVGLPVHDSFIVAVQYEDILRETMRIEYRRVFGNDPVIG
nr:hypothetical protein [Pseudodesulfovibrio sp.]